MGGAVIVTHTHTDLTSTSGTFFGTTQPVLHWAWTIVLQGCEPSPGRGGGWSCLHERSCRWLKCHGKLVNRVFDESAIFHIQQFCQVIFISNSFVCGPIVALKESTAKDLLVEICGGKKIQLYMLPCHEFRYESWGCSTYPLITVSNYHIL